MLIAPNLALETENQSLPPPSPISISHYALEAPRTPVPTLREYAASAAEETEIDGDKFIKLIGCESRWDEEAKGDNGTSHGILQFKEATFEMFAGKYGIANPDISNPYHQIDLAAFMIRDGYIGHWKNCADKIEWYR